MSHCERPLDSACNARPRAWVPTQGGNLLTAAISLSPVQFQDLQLWSDALFNESLAGDLADDMSNLGIAIDSITYTAKFAFGAPLLSPQAIPQQLVLPTVTA